MRYGITNEGHIRVNVLMSKNRLILYRILIDFKTVLLTLCCVIIPFKFVIYIYYEKCSCYYTSESTILLDIILSSRFLVVFSLFRPSVIYGNNLFLR